jgi:KaiC/GvpD/RAD55 family RecA-like ATPase
VRGATQFGESGVFMMFEENAPELSANVRSLGFDLEKVAAQKMILLDYVHVERSEIEETGEYNLAGLFIRLGHAIDSIGANAACGRGENALLFAYEESRAQIVRNMRSIGIDLEPWIEKGLLEIHASRPTLHGLEQHLVMMHDAVRAFRPSVVAVDPISNLTLGRHDLDVKPTLMRLIDFLKQQQITTLFTCLSSDGGATPEDSQLVVSSLMDTWLLLRNVEFNDERNRTIYVLKSRGMAHSNQVREFVLSDAGIDLVDVYVGADRVLTGTARVTQETHERTAAEVHRQGHQRRLLPARRQAQGDRGTDRRAASRGGIGSGRGELRHRAADLAGANQAAEHPGHAAAPPAATAG